jgi:enoyl-CoA hydratase
MANENILYDASSGIARITINRPQVLNALDRKTMEELSYAFDRADINELARQTAVEGNKLSAFTRELFSRPAVLGKPSIAAVNGFALGGGCELALACSLRIASRTARFGLPEVKLGIIPGAGGTQRLARLCGKGAALELILTGEMIAAEEALRIGLVNRVVEPAQLLPAAEGLAKKIIANAPLAVKFAMEAVERSLDVPLEEGLYLESGLFSLCCATEDMREGTRAFVEKRAPNFQGR